MIRKAIIVLLACAGVFTRSQAAPATLQSGEDVAAVSQKTAGEVEFEALANEYQAAEAAFWERQTQASERERITLLKDRPAIRPYLMCFASLADCNAGTELAAACYAWIVAHDRGGAARGDALSVLLRDHMESLHFITVCAQLARSLTRTSGELLAEIATRTPHREVRGHALYQRAKHLLRRARSAEVIKSAGSEELDRLEEQFGASSFEELRAANIGALDEEAERLLLRVRAEYEGIALSRDRSLESAAEGELFELKYLGVGKTAPEIRGEDLIGCAFRLSEYRGKVVVIDFWGDWCEPSRASYASQRALIQRQAAAPFVYLGVNSDADRRRLQLFAETTWRSWWNGGSPQGGIAAEWNVTAWPTTYLLDHHGTIRYKNLRGEPLAAAIGKLLAEAETWVWTPDEPAGMGSCFGPR